MRTFVSYKEMLSPGVEKHDIALFSLHQMGSCRMGKSIEDSVADGEGECWECSDLFIADASAFPTASGMSHHSGKHNFGSENTQMPSE